MVVATVAFMLMLAMVAVPWQAMRLLQEAGARAGSGATGPRTRGPQGTVSRQGRADAWRGR